MEKKLMKSENDRIICGVCGGVAEYLNVDPTLVRLGWLGATIIGGVGVLPYLIAAIIIPRRF